MACFFRDRLVAWPIGGATLWLDICHVHSPVVRSFRLGLCCWMWMCRPWRWHLLLLYDSWRHCGGYHWRYLLLILLLVMLVVVLLMLLRRILRSRWRQAVLTVSASIVGLILRRRTVHRVRIGRHWLRLRIWWRVLGVWRRMLTSTVVLRVPIRISIAILLITILLTPILLVAVLLITWLWYWLLAIAVWLPWRQRAPIAHRDICSRENSPTQSVASLGRQVSNSFIQDACVSLESIVGNC